MSETVSKAVSSSSPKGPAGAGAVMAATAVLGRPQTLLKLATPPTKTDKTVTEDKADNCEMSAEGKCASSEEVPDSTTSQLETKHSFSCGDDVFVKQKDGRYYLGMVIQADKANSRWLVRFGDETSRWACGGELRPLAVEPEAADAPAMCVVCKQRGGEVVACDLCGRGYHRACHGPTPHHSWIPGASWQCRRCVDQRFKCAMMENRAAKKELQAVKQNNRPHTTLPYDLSVLHWEPLHRVNTERIYCYCGGGGDWYGQMLQCARCRQWFHQRCLSCLKYPLYSGDRFYLFVCSVCNYGTEYVRRLEMKWVDLVHLMLYNLTTHNTKKYYDLDTVIIPYIMDNWYALQLSTKMQAATPSERRESIISALSNNRSRFKCGREIKKRATIWGLRCRGPPPPPPQAPLLLPARGQITDQLADQLARKAFVQEPKSQSPSSSSGGAQRMIISMDSHWFSVVTGKRFQGGCNNSSDNESPASSPSPSPSPTDFQPATSLPTYSFSSKYNGYNLPSKERVNSPYSFREDAPLIDKPSAKVKELKLYSMDYNGGGFVKKSVPFPKSSQTKHKKSKRNKKAKGEASEKDGSKKLLRNTIAKKNMIENIKVLSRKGTNTLIEEESAYSMKDSNFEGAMKSSEVILPPTPPTSVSAPPTPPALAIPSSSSSSNDAPSDFSNLKMKPICSYDSDADGDFKDFKNSAIDLGIKSDVVTSTETVTKSFNGVFSNGHNSKIAAINLEISKLSTKNIIEHSKIMSLHHKNSKDTYSLFNLEHDSSGDDTSSRGTLDSIIPPPVNFQGKNNPFHPQPNKSNLKATLSAANKLFNSRLSLSKVSTGNGGHVKNQRISLPASLNAVIGPTVKTFKRQLSEKDLVIGPNGEVKRRRYRRPRKAGQLISNKEGTSSERQRSLRSSLGQEDVSKAQICPADVQQVSTCVDYSLNVRRLRQRQERNYFDGRRGSTSSNNATQITTTSISQNISISSTLTGASPNTSGLRSLNLSPQKLSPFKNGQNSVESSSSIEELKTSVHSYFGASNRIASGEKFSLVGKRITDSGSIQYLIEWEGHGS